MRTFSILCSIVLAIYIALETARSPGKYRELKASVDGGDQGARRSFYVEILWFEWISAALAFAAAGFSRTAFRPDGLGLAESSFGQAFAGLWTHIDGGFAYGMGIGAVIMLALMPFLLRILRNRSDKTVAVPTSRFLPDFSYLLPVTPRERWLFAFVAISAGICEELVFRGWLLNALHSLHAENWTLVALAAAIFGAAHFYQGVAGVIVTLVLGLIFCGLYVASGTLLVPIALHAILDLRWAIAPAAK